MATLSSILAWKSHGQRSLAGYIPQGCEELDTTRHTHVTLIKYERGLQEGIDNKMQRSSGLSWRLAYTGSDECYGGYKAVEKGPRAEFGVTVVLDTDGQKAFTYTEQRPEGIEGVALWIHVFLGSRFQGRLSSPPAPPSVSLRTFFCAPRLPTYTLITPWHLPSFSSTRG